MSIYKFEKESLIRELSEKLDDDVFAKFALQATSDSYIDDEELISEFIDNELIEFNDQLERFIQAHISQKFDRKLKELVARTITYRGV